MEKLPERRLLAQGQGVEVHSWSTLSPMASLPLFEEILKVYAVMKLLVRRCFDMSCVSCSGQSWVWCFASSCGQRKGITRVSN